LDAYDFASDGSEEIQEDNKTLISASVLGLIFEKINGYKEGSFFTPGFITMYMSRQAIKDTVVRKFNDVKGWHCTSIHEVYNKIEVADRNAANDIVNSIKICDPAVGSGHFLVSALNEIIAIKAELRLLQDKQGKRLKEYSFEVVNDELIVSDESGELIEYNSKNPESQRIQETLFNEKQVVIENCLFGVDINPNSVNICRLRLWIELLKNAYYKEDGELETLPNIDINIKCGNSLISRFALDIDLKDALKKSKLSISKYKSAVKSYKNATSKEHKRELEDLIATVKNEFRSDILSNDPKVLKLYGFKDQLRTLQTQENLFPLSAKDEKTKKETQIKLINDIAKLEGAIEEIKGNKIYENAFEWRFEFPEVLSDDGEFFGFDVIIGNPPYVVLSSAADPEFKYLQEAYKTSFGRINTFAIFTENVTRLLAKGALCAFIIPDSICNIDYYMKLRKFLLDNHSLREIIELGDGVFDEAVVPAVIFMFSNVKSVGNQILLGIGTHYLDLKGKRFLKFFTKKLRNIPTICTLTIYL
jgi:adenine-specific DNA-methyltransferase